jgi:coenzyme F420-dependent glucose-6-phosphate dehydrogenase
MIGFHASHEQFKPSHLLTLAQLAEQAGFQCLFSSDHFHPWGTVQGQSGFSFAWLGAALQATSLPARVICCPYARYHPAIVAQAAATLAEMFENRFALAIGTGQALNEHITGNRWPNKMTRNELLKESARIIRALWKGECVSSEGPIPIDEAKLFTRPRRLPLLIGAAVTAETASWMGSWVDALVTTSRPPEEARKLIAAFRENGGEKKPIFLKVGLSYARTETAALKQAHEQWRNAAFPNHVLTEVKTTAQFDALGERVRPEDMKETLRVSGDLGQHRAWIEQDLQLGFSEIYLHNVGLNQEQFIEDFANHVLPSCRQTPEPKT